MTKITGTIFTSIDLSSAYNQVPLKGDTRKNKNLFRRKTIRLSCRILWLRSSINKIMRHALGPHIKRKQAIT